MSITDQYFMYHTLFELVKYEKYEMVHINVKRNEAWIQKKVGGQTTVIRFMLKQFDWPSHLKKDIANVFQRVSAMKRVFRTKKVNIYNVYMGHKQPIDSEDLFQHPIIANENNRLKMNVYYIADENELEEKKRFLHDVHNRSFQFDMNDLSILQYKVQNYKTYLQRKIFEKNKEIKEVFTYGKISLTYIFMLLNVFIFFLLELNGNSTNELTLIQYGANENTAIAQGEWWRLFTAAFIHSGFLHFFINLLALYYIGQFVERIYGSKSFFIIYILGVCMGNIWSFAFHDGVSVGASGGIFALFGALLYFGTKYRDLFVRTIRNHFMFLLILQILLMMAVPQVDNVAHIGGLFGGFLAAMITMLPFKKSLPLQLIGLLLYTSVAIFLYNYGLQLLA